MRNFSPFRAKLLAAFVLLTLAVTLCMGAAGWLGSSALGRHMLEKQASRIMDTLLEAERQALAARDMDAEDEMESGLLAQVLGWKFLVGKEVPAQWLSLREGMHFLPEEKGFTLICWRDGTIYALNGNMDEFYATRREIMRLLLACGALGIAAAIGMAFALSRNLSRPLLELARAIGKRNSKILPPSQSLPEFPKSLLSLNDEVGLLARELAKNEAELHDFLWRECCFTGDVSHELRTPLAVLQGGLEILEREFESLPADSAKKSVPVLRRLSRTVTGMGATTRSLLLLARSPQNLVLTDLNLSALARQMLLELERAGIIRLYCRKQASAIQGAEKLPRLFAEIGADVMARGNPELVEMILKNLLDNAIAYGLDGEIALSLGQNALQIRNSGRLPAHVNIFERGARGHAGKPGHGFGLSLALRACERLNWRLEYGQAQGETVFTVIFATKSMWEDR